jgi:hypothetical protein
VAHYLSTPYIYDFSELDLILNKEREEIEKLKKEIPEQFHPPTNMYEAMFPPEKRPSSKFIVNNIF